MTKAIEVITSVQRRRRWSRAEKERIVAAALELGASDSRVRARRGSTRANCSGGANSSASERRCRRRSIRSRSRLKRHLHRQWPLPRQSQA